MEDLVFPSEDENDGCAVDFSTGASPVQPATIPPGDPRSIENLGLAWLAGDE